MDEFTAVSRARETWALFAEALQKGREILLRAGIAEAPPAVPDFDTVYRHRDTGVIHNPDQHLACWTQPHEGSGRVSEAPFRDSDRRATAFDRT